MIRSPLSIRQMLLTMACVLLLIISATTYWSADVYGNRAARLSFDRLMLGATLQMAENINMINGEVVIDLPRSAFSTLAMAANDRAFYAVLNSDKQLLTGYGHLPENPKAAVLAKNAKEVPEAVFYNAPYSGEQVRFVTVKRQLIEDELSTEVLIKVGQTMLARNALAAEISALALQFIVVFLLVTLLLIMFGVWLVLRPLSKLKKSIDKRSPVELTPLKTTVPKEILPLVNTLNHFMSQLDLTLNRLQRFTAEAAHQLRTPLAGLRAQAQNALEEDDQKRRHQQLLNVLQSTDLLSDTIDQFLNRATLAQRFQSEVLKPLSLDELTKDTCRELAVWALQKNVEIAYLSKESVWLKGDRFSLQQMIRNILENAVKYSPAGGLVEVDIQVLRKPNLHSENRCILLLIKDCGMGISDAEKQQVFEPFYRSCNNRNPGTGIGLSIAKEVAEHHCAELSLKDNQPNGLIVEVIFNQSAIQL